MASAYAGSNGYASSEGERGSSGPSSIRPAQGPSKAAKVTAAAAADGEDEGAAGGDDAQRKKRKKAVRACNHCQTAHLTCDDNRPCGRCVKRSLGDTCMDGARKKAKYLRDIEDALVNAGKANPTHFIHSPPVGNDSSNANAQADTSLGPQAAAEGSNRPQARSASRSRSNGDSSSGSPANPTPRSNQLNLAKGPGNSLLANNAPLLHQPMDDNATSKDPRSAQIFERDLLAAPSSTTGNAVTSDFGITSPNTHNSSNNNNTQSQPFSFFSDLNMGGNSDFTPGNNNSANLEYAVLSSMLQNSGYSNASPMSFGNQQLQPPSSSIYQGIFTGSGDYGQMSFGFPPAAFENGSGNTQHNVGNTSNINSTATNQYMGHSDATPPGINPYLSSNGQQQMSPRNSSMPSLHTPMNAFGALPMDHNWPTIASTLPQNNDTNVPQPQPLQLPRNHSSERISSVYPQARNGNTSSAQKTLPTISSTGVMKVEDVYKHVNRPHNYLEAYHALIRHLQSNFENKSHVLRIIRALAIYRPSIIALHMPLTVDDEIFVERSFQRTLIEVEKLISFSGTPTLVWRRTGEIVLVGTEFSLLSEWKREDLLCRNRTTSAGDASDPVKEKKHSKAKRRFIFEVFDQESLVEYYETFAQHAFESSSATIMSTCNILTPKGRKVPCTFGYNLKRDIFGLPQMILGQFLPILTAPENSPKS